MQPNAACGVQKLTASLCPSSSREQPASSRLSQWARVLTMQQPAQPRALRSPAQSAAFMCSAASERVHSASSSTGAALPVSEEAGHPAPQRQARDVSGDWRAKSKPIKPGGVYPAKELCSQCGLCDT